VGKKINVNEDEETARRQAKAKLESIMEMVKKLDSENEDEKEGAMTIIMEHPLSVQVRTGWYTPGEEPEEAEYEILLCTGGPAVRILGDLGQYKEPMTAKIQYQDWFISWTDLSDISSMEEKALLRYAGCFYYGE